MIEIYDELGNSLTQTAADSINITLMQHGVSVEPQSFIIWSVIGVTIILGFLFNASCKIKKMNSTSPEEFEWEDED